jgi:hypothetical protein
MKKIFTILLFSFSVLFSAENLLTVENTPVSIVLKDNTGISLPAITTTNKGSWLQSGNKIIFTPKRNETGKDSLTINTEQGELLLNVVIEPSDFKVMLTKKCSVPDAEYVKAWDHVSGIFNGSIECSNRTLQEEDLKDFIFIKEITGDANFRSANLTSTKYFKNLTRIGGRFDLALNKLKTLEGLEKLENVGSFQIDNNELEDISALESLNYIQSSFRFHNQHTNNVFKDISVLAKVEHSIGADAVFFEIPINNKLKHTTNFCKNYWKFSNGGSMFDICLFKKIPAEFSGFEKNEDGSIGGDRTKLPGTMLSQDLIPVDATRKYKLTFDARAGDENGSNYGPENLNYFGIACYDVDKNFIYYHLVHSYRGGERTKTVLTRPLKKGDTSMYIKDGSQWRDFNGHIPRPPEVRYNQDHTAGFAWYPYTDSVGRQYEDYFFT